MSELLDALIEQRRNEALEYQEYLRRIVELTKKVTSPEASGEYPAGMNTAGKRALYDNLDKDEGLALAVDAAVRASRQDDWRSNPFKIRRVRNAIRTAFETGQSQAESRDTVTQTGVMLDPPGVYVRKPSESLEERVDRIFALVKNQDEY
jgi:type I restriction enzyme R subunit